jgi:hypothetical protein
MEFLKLEPHESFGLSSGWQNKKHDFRRPSHNESDILVIITRTHLASRPRHDNTGCRD